MAKKRCGSCRFFEDAGIAGSGWCHHPLRRTSNDLILMVRRNELACRDAWAGSFWEAGSYVADTGEEGLTPTTAVEPLPVSDVASLLDGRESASLASEPQDVVLGEARLVTNATPPWRKLDEPLAPVDAPPATRALDSRTALLRARESFRTRRQTTSAELPFAPEFAIPATDDEAVDRLRAAERPQPDRVRDDGGSGTGVPAHQRQVEAPADLDDAALLGAAPIDAEESVDDAALEAIDWAGQFDPETSDFAGADPYRADGGAEAEELDDADATGTPVSEGTGVPATAYDHEPDPGTATGETISTGRWTFEYRPQPRENWEWEPMFDGTVARTTPSVGRSAPGTMGSVGPQAEGVGTASRRESPGPRARGAAGSLYEPELPFASSESERLASAGWDVEVVDPFGPGDAAGVGDHFLPGDREDADDVLSGPIAGMRANSDQLDDRSWTAEPVSVAPEVPRTCRTCRDYRPGENGSRGWCANQWAFAHPRMVEPDSPPACESALGCWWLPADDLRLDQVDISAHAYPTPHLDRWLPQHGDEDRQRKQS